MLEKKLYIKDLREGQAIDGLFLVKESNRAETRTGNPFLILTVTDRSGDVGGRLWDNVDQYMNECPVGGIIQLKGQAQSYKGVLQLKIDSIRAVDRQEVDLAWFLPACDGDPESMALELQELIRGIAQPELRKLLQRLFRSPEILERFKKAPAAKRMHHAYLGGLLEHTLAVARLSLLLAETNPILDRSLLLAGAILHDLGKIHEFSYDSYPFDYTDRGRLEGHLVIGVEMVQEQIAAIKNFPADLASRLKHLILSHHGRHEFGSPTLPMLAEAFVLNQVDDLDAKLNYIQRLATQARDAEYHWTDYQKVLERFLFIRGLPDREDDAGQQTDTAARAAEETRQQSLFS